VSLGRRIPEPLRPLARRVRRALGGTAQKDAAGSTTPPATGKKAGVGTRDELHAFWQDPDAPNRPELYAEPVERSRFLLEWIEPHVARSGTVLEIGTNIGRNLEQLRLAGYKNLEGIEISANAVAAMGTTYPDLTAMATIRNAPVEDVIVTYQDASFDLVFTMAVLEHIHPDSEWIFADMVRICRGVIVTIEDEHGRSRHHTPRDYRAVFEGLGMQQVAEQEASEVMGIDGFHARIFRHAPDESDRSAPPLTAEFEDG
jgi:SAM-dependent methyltransferase